MRVLVTGAAGFVGQHLVRDLLRAGCDVFAGTTDDTLPVSGTLSEAEHAAAEWVILDVTREDTLARSIALARPAIVYHLAGQSSVAGSFADRRSTWDVNASGTLRLLSALREGGCEGSRVLLASSAEVYGNVPEAEQPISEDRPLCPASPYASSKAAAEMLAIEASLTGGPEVIVARSFNHIGPGHDARFALPSFAHQLAKFREDGAERVLQVGNLEVRRDLLDVRDAVAAYRLLVRDGDAGNTYNVCSGRARDLREVVDELVRISGTGARIAVDPERLRTVDIPLLVGDGSKLRRLGWEPMIPLAETLADLFSSVS
ncbi:MAG: GDP-mannose 4,6-dehydratase [Gemmatimonadota bacterium]|nr:GDP-mannose 4,6-dehydratase [Gemmatimonadota bacterium]